MTKIPTEQRLRDMCVKLRTTSMPISDIIPLLQEAADKIDSLEECLDNAYREMNYMVDNNDN